MSDFESEDFIEQEEFNQAQDLIDLSMPDLMAEAANINEWTEEIAFNFIRRGYLKGKSDGIAQIVDEIKDEL